ncbi:MAG: hypothetical protein II882_04830 [Lachnospiraceae bacterium]|nr:hypothetical protein [Lachnospiraceae bacterium]
MSVDLLFLNNKDMEKLGVGDMNAAIHDVERAYVLTEQGDVLAPGKCVMRWGSTPEDENIYGRINAMPGMIGGEYNMAGIKWIGSGPMNYKKGLPRASVTVVLNDPDTKLPVCIADGTAVSAKRTGASGGIAMKLLSVENAKALTICGAGAQGRTQLEAALIVRPSLETVYIYDIMKDRSELFAEESKAKYPNVNFVPVDDPEEAVRKSDITVCVTLANEPIIHSGWLKKGSLIMNMADFEVTYDCVRKADKIVVDNWETIKHRLVSTVSLMARDGLIKDEDIHAQLGEILCGKKTGRENDEEIIYFNAVGTGILDIAVTTRCYKKALEEGVGTVLPYWE